MRGFERAVENGQPCEAHRVVAHQSMLSSVLGNFDWFLFRSLRCSVLRIGASAGAGLAPGRSRGLPIGAQAIKLMKKQAGYSSVRDNGAAWTSTQSIGKAGPDGATFHRSKP
jgi:hypothetical protein